MKDSLLLVLAGTPDAYLRRQVTDALARLPEHGCVVLDRDQGPRDVELADFILREMRLAPVDFKATFEGLLRARGEHLALDALQSSLDHLAPAVQSRYMGPTRCLRCNRRASGVLRCPGCGSDRLEPVDPQAMRGAIPATSRKEARARRGKRP